MSTAPPPPNGTPRAVDPAVLIGALVPLTRPGWVDAGRQLLAGLELSVQDANDSGGIGGRRLEMVVRDTAADPRAAEEAVDDLTGLGAAAVAGEYHSVAARAAAARAHALGLPFLCSSAVIDTLIGNFTDWVARLAPAQSRSWRIYAEYLLGAGHERIAVAAQSSVYWAAGIGILRDHLAPRGAVVVEVDARAPRKMCDEVVRSGATALLLLMGYPEPAASAVRTVRRDLRLSGVAIGAPAGQPEFAQWEALLGADGAGIPFLRYMPERLSPLGARVAADLRERLAQAPSFVAFEGYDTVVVLAQMLRQHGGRLPHPPAWSQVAVEGTRGDIRFTREPGITVWQWTWPPVLVADRDPERIDRFRTLRAD